MQGRTAIRWLLALLAFADLSCQAAARKRKHGSSFLVKRADFSQPRIQRAVDCQKTGFAGDCSPFMTKLCADAAGVQREGKAVVVAEIVKSCSSFAQHKEEPATSEVIGKQPTVIVEQATNLVEHDNEEHRRQEGRRDTEKHRKHAAKKHRGKGHKKGTKHDDKKAFDELAVGFASEQQIATNIQALGKNSADASGMADEKREQQLAKQDRAAEKEEKGTKHQQEDEKGTMSSHERLLSTKDTPEDWRGEYGPKAVKRGGDWSYEVICTKHPENKWCIQNGYVKEPVAEDATSNFFLAAGLPEEDGHHEMRSSSPANSSLSLLALGSSLVFLVSTIL